MRRLAYRANLLHPFAEVVAAVRDNPGSSNLSSSREDRLSHRPLDAESARHSPAPIAAAPPCTGSWPHCKRAIGSNGHKVFREVDPISLFSLRRPYIDRVRRNPKPKHAGATSGYRHPKMVSLRQFFLERHNWNIRCRDALKIKPPIGPEREIGSAKLYGLRRRHHRISAGLRGHKVASRMAGEDRNTKRIQPVCFIRYLSCSSHDTIPKV